MKLDVDEMKTREFRREQDDSLHTVWSVGKPLVCDLGDGLLEIDRIS